MFKRLTLYISICLLSLITCVSYAAAKKAPVVLHSDTSAISIKKFSSSAIKQYTADPDFSYADGVAEQASLWQRFWVWFWRILGGFFANTSLSGLFACILIILAIAGLVYIILKFTGVDITGLLLRRNKKTHLAYEESLENIHEIDFDSEIDQAISQQNYRLAVRLLYLKCLKQLSDRDLIDWQLNKTNAAYYYELNNTEQRNAFGTLTRRFEYVWYGGFVIDERSFRDINQRFQQFKQHLA